MNKYLSNHAGYTSTIDNLDAASEVLTSYNTMINRKMT